MATESPLEGETRAYRHYIGGEWRESSDGERRDCTTPVTGEVIATVPDGTRADARAAAAAAADVQPELERWSAFERAELCHELADAVEDAREELLSWLIADQGKPRSDAEYEVDGCAKLFRIAAEDAKRDEPPTIESERRQKHVFTMRKPHGVYGVITPWNFPLNIPAEYLAPGLAVGNAIAWCPAPSTSAVAAKLMEVLAGTSLPDGALNLVIGSGPVVGNELVESDRVDAIGFTGSPETGEAIASAAGAKPTLLEMGGNGPVIVLDDADLEAAASAAAAGAFTNAGQICSASERILVHEAVHDEFVDALVDRAERTEVGSPYDDADMGPLNNADVADKMDRHVADARDEGATVLAGGARADGHPTDLYYRATVLDDVSTEMAVNREESFGPIAPVLTFSDPEEAIEMTNEIGLGLTSGVFTSDVGLLYEFAERIETGIVNVNDGSTYWEKHLPFGGYSGKDSGVGRLGGRRTLEEMSQLKTVIVDTGTLPDRG